jgi:hypothetical protein
MRRALTKLLPEDHQSFGTRSYKRRDNNERPKYQNVHVSFSSSAFFLIRFLQLAAQHIAAPAGGLHLSPASTEMAERSFRAKAWLGLNSPRVLVCFNHAASIIKDTNRCLEPPLLDPNEQTLRAIQKGAVTTLF